MSLLNGEYSFHILPANPIAQPGLMDLHNKLYAFWRDTWTQYLNKKQLPALNKDEFLRQDYLVGITKDNEVVSSHLYSVFDCRSSLTWECQYFSQLAPELKQYCETEKVDSILTQEYLAVDPSVRGQQLSVSFPIVMLGLAGEFMKHINCGSTAGTVRAGAPTVEVACKAINCITLETITTRYNIDHKFFIVPRWKFTSPGDELTQAFIKHLWTTRMDYTGINNRENELAKIA